MAAADSVLDGLPTLHDAALLPDDLQRAVASCRMGHRAVVNCLCLQFAAYVHLTRRVLVELLIMVQAQAQLEGQMDTATSSSNLLSPEDLYRLLADTQTVTLIGGGFVGCALARYAVDHRLFAAGNISIATRQPDTLCTEEMRMQNPWLRSVNLMSAFSFKLHRVASAIGGGAPVFGVTDSDFIVLACKSVQVGHVQQALCRHFCDEQRPIPPLRCAPPSLSSTMRITEVRSPVPLLISCIIGETYGRLRSNFQFLSPTSMPPPVVVIAVDVADEPSPLPCLGAADMCLRHLLDATYYLVLAFFDIDPLSGYSSQGSYRGMTYRERFSALRCVLRGLLPGATERAAVAEQALMQAVQQYSSTRLGRSSPKNSDGSGTSSATASQDLPEDEEIRQLRLANIHPYAATMEAQRAEAELPQWYLLPDLCGAARGSHY
ncbi:hypothetical protein RI367_000228 [Sorochytrium milnesiophthora]